MGLALQKRHITAKVLLHIAEFKSVVLFLFFTMRNNQLFYLDIMF